jgi:TPR repeat protein
MFKWLHKAAPRSGALKPRAQVSELGAPRGEGDAIKWFRKAAEKGTCWGQYNLAIRYAKGDGIPQDYAEALKWFQKGAEHNDGMSQYQLGLIYEKGLGVPVDLAASYKWYSLAASQGIRDADNACHHLQTGLTSEQIAAGQAHRFQPVPKKSA